MSHDANSTWVALSEYGEGNIFHLFPKILANLILEEEASRVEGDTSEAEKLVLPSEKEWRQQQYFVLVAMQKKMHGIEGSATASAEIEISSPKETLEEWNPWQFVVYTRNPNAPPPVAMRQSPGPTWELSQVLKAVGLLKKPPDKVTFVDEQEMRCVYSIIYDVFRYKTIMDQVITDISFYQENYMYTNHHQIVQVFLMELARRCWVARPRNDNGYHTQLLRESGSPYKEIEAAVWDQRVHFAAALAKLRIKNKAFELSELLPQHLREERVSANVYKQTVTGWVNTFKSKRVATLVKRLHEEGYTYSNSRQLCSGEYRFDRVCPRFITLRPPAGTSICELDLVRDGVIVLQEREFCEGASTLCRALRANCLLGAVAQTHASCPRSSAYLAAQLRELAVVLRQTSPLATSLPQLGRLIVFGAGDNVQNYVLALRELGIEASEMPQSEAPVCVLSDAVHMETPMVTSALDGVVAVLATPPNTYSSVTDPIDLVVGMGGDLAMLEILTETDLDKQCKGRAQFLLEEQKKTLKVLLSKPQIQMILYETHSALEAENQAQVSRAVADANRLARERHALLRKRNKMDDPTLSDNSVSSMDNTISRSNSNEDLADALIQGLLQNDKNHSRKKTVLKKTAKMFTSAENSKNRSAKPISKTNVQKDGPSPKKQKKDADADVPKCDLFEVTTLPNLGNGLDINYILDRDGCYLGLIQRKEITHLNAKYMISVAEERGVFGQVAPLKTHTDKALAAQKVRRHHRHSFQVERLAAPTYNSLARHRPRRGSAPGAATSECPDRGAVCDRHARRQAAAGIFTAACTCSARHKIVKRPVTEDLHQLHQPAKAPTAPCRKLYPIVVHELKFPDVPGRRRFRV